MEESQTKDAITRKQTLFLEVTDKNAVLLFQDENLMSILTFLRSTQYMTIRDMEQAFEESGNEKSKKTIYRYLKKLEESNLIAQAGKRVTASTSEKLKTETLYMRTAKIFFPKREEEELDPESERSKKIFEDAISKLLIKHLEKKGVDVAELGLVIKELKLKMFEYSTFLLKNADEEIANLVSNLDWKSVNYLIDIMGFLALLTDDIDWNGKILSCFE
jgi:DNA-binding PadR family transcriptional regulator